MDRHAHNTAAMESEIESGAALDSAGLFNSLDSCESGRLDSNQRPLGPKATSHLTTEPTNPAEVASDSTAPRITGACESVRHAAHSARDVANETPAVESVDYTEAQRKFALRTTINGNGCWIWTGPEKSNGYGAACLNGLVQRAHRVAHQIFVGAIPAGHFVLHSCDTPICVNPSHLFVGSHSDNMRDCAAKGRLHIQKHPRALRGELNPGAKLRLADVEEIRHASTRGERALSLAERFGVSPSQIHRIIRGARWGGSPVPEAMEGGPRC